MGSGYKKLLISVMFVPIAFWNVAPSGPESVIPLTSLGAYYKFDSNSLDSSGNGINGTNINIPQYVAGYFNQAISLNGTTNYVQTADSPFLEGSLSNISVFGWVKITSYSGTFIQANQHLASKLNNFITSGWRIIARSSSILVNVGATNISRGTGVPAGAWSFIGFTFNNNVLKIYQNGVQIGSDAILGSRVLSNANTMQIGRRNIAAVGAIDGNLFGLIDDLHIWQRVLTPTEIATLYASPLPLTT